MSEMEEIQREFLAESRENLDRLERRLMAWETEAQTREGMDEIFRAMHSLKGSAAFLGFARLESLAHAGESLLSAIRDGRLALSPAIVAATLELVDCLRTILDRLELEGREGTGPDEQLIARLGRLERAQPVVSEVPRPPSAIAEQRGADRTVRIDVALLDQLLNLVGELVLTRDRLDHLAAGAPALSSVVQRLGAISTSLQGAALQMRMRPIESLWSKFPRLVRDLALSLEKSVRLNLEGQDTELDRGMIEAIKDPLTHLLRNAVDHGIERPEIRRAAGKPPQGVITLRASYAEGRARIEVRDDGAGIDPERVKRRALELGLLDPVALEKLAPRDLLELIFRPGFSTVDAATNVSGRGVGMDVVRTNVERVGGTIEVETELGRGTTIELNVPLTLAIMPALIVKSAGRRYAIAREYIRELVRFEPGEGRDRIEQIQGAPVYRLRGALLPLVQLRAQLGDEAGSPQSAVSLVVLEADHRSFGLIVDDVEDARDIVVKPLSLYAMAPPQISAATLLEDGTVALILDVQGLARGAHVFAAAQAPTAAPASAPTPTVPSDAHERLLLLGGRHGERMAIPIERVSRLETIAPSSVERLGGWEVVQYRGRILRLVRLSDALVERRRSPRGPREPETGGSALQVVVCSGANGEAGLVVEKILDVADEAIQSRSPATRGGVLCSTVIREQVTELLDVDKLLPARAEAG